MIFADTSFYQAFFNLRDENHAEASRIIDLMDSGTVVTTEWILAEFLNTTSRSPNGRHSAIKLVNNIFSDSTVEVIHASHEQFIQALTLYCDRSDKAWSLIYCISFQLMWERGITHALAFDEHFWQAGFRPLK